MLLIPTYLAQSQMPGAGLGLYCREAVKAGTLVWLFMPEFDRKISQLPIDPVLKDYVRKHGFVPLADPGTWILPLDNACFVNHSETPNCRSLTEPPGTVAAIDLAAGTELTEDYRTFCADPFEGWDI